MAKKTAVTPDPNEALLTLARKRFRMSADAEATLRKNQLEAKKFAGGEHWDPVVKARREEDGDPCLTFDLLKPQIKQITNQQRAMRPAVNVNPVDNGADVETAEVFQGIIRHIEADSDADDAYDQAGKDQTEIGRGWFKFTTEYCDDETGDQKIKIERIRNPFSVYPDPSVKRRDYSDAKFLLETSDWLPEDLKERFPNAKFVNVDDFEGIGDDGAKWINGERIRVALYWTVNTTRTLLALGVGRSRPVKAVKVSCHTITGLEVLESYEWAGKYIPYVPVIGEEIDLEGKVEYRGVVWGAMSPSRAFDYIKSKAIEVIALTPLAPYVAEEGQLEGHEAMWEQANRKKFPVLQYKRVGLSGQPAPPPQRSFGEPPVQALNAEAAEAQNLVRMSTGFFNPLDRPKDESGVALRERRQQGEHGNSDYLDGLARGIRFGGRILIDLIPKIYDVPRVFRILGKDNQPKSVVVHAGNAEAAQGMDGEGIKGIYDLGAGVYDVTVTVGSTETARQEFVEQVGELFQAHPEVFSIIGDLYFDHMDMPGAKQIAERLKKTLPENLQDQDPGSPASLQMKASQLGQQVQQMGQALQEAQRKIETDEAKQGASIKIKEMDLEFQREKLAVESETKITVAELSAKIDRMALFLEERARLGVQTESERARGHEAGLSEAGRRHEAAMSTQSHEQGLESGAAGSELAMAQAEHAQSIAPVEEAA
jgi:hypothetical protein